MSACKFESFLEVIHQWDSMAFETTSLVPRNAAAAVITWTENDHPEGGPSPSLADALARGMIMLGEVAFRCRAPEPADARLLGEVDSVRRLRWVAVASRDATAITALFASDWAQGDGAALIGVPDGRALDLLSSPCWTDVRLQAGELALAAIVDGAGLMIAAPTRTALDKAVAAVLQPAVDAGFVASRQA